MLYRILRTNLQINVGCYINSCSDPITNRVGREGATHRATQMQSVMHNGMGLPWFGATGVDGGWDMNGPDWSHIEFVGLYM